MNPTQTQSSHPFHAYGIALELTRAVIPLAGRIGEHDSNLAKQLTRAATSVPLNLAEGRRHSGGTRTHHYRIAAGSADETLAALDVAEAAGFVTAAAAADARAFANRVLAMTWRLTHPQRR